MSDINSDPADRKHKSKVEKKKKKIRKVTNFDCGEMEVSASLNAFIREHAATVETPESRQHDEFKRGVNHHGVKHPAPMSGVSRRQPRSAPLENGTTKNSIRTPSPHSSNGFMESPDTFLQRETQPLPMSLIQNRFPASGLVTMHQYTDPLYLMNNFQPQIYQVPGNNIQMQHSHVYQMQLDQMATHQTQVNDMHMSMNLQTFGGVQIGPHPSEYEVSNVEDTGPWLLEDDDQILIDLARELFP